MEIVATDKAPAAIGPYSQAVKSGSLLFCSGQIPLVPETGEMVTGDIRQETEQVMNNLSAVLAAGGTGFDRVVRTTIYLVDMADFPVVNEVYGSFFSAAKPARATVAVAALPRGARVEIDAVAEL
ncbi:RidA family protein [Trichlorobacter ammonificans]|uniref:Protein DfrA n=1 Tax=Trichlorobacter ammonificans TaxID=2916410 RepID=A0ABN8HEX9_9BACT|nr:RidA family protein [Trichlorobacter ammonificans]CAH2031315.1 Protein DfrA [Trichlorobacter ammonificans]